MCCCVPLHVQYMCLCKQPSVYCKQESGQSSVCPSLRRLLPPLPTHHAGAARPRCPPCGVSTCWYLFVLSLKDHLRRTSSPPRGARWRPAAVTFSSAGSEGRGHERGRSWSTVLGAGQRCLRGEAAWSSAGHCRQHSECLVPSEVLHLRLLRSPQQAEVQGMGWSYCVLTSGVPLTSSDDHAPWTHPLILS